MSELDFVHELAAVVNRQSRENASNTPDVFLADFMAACLGALEVAVNKRSNWYGRHDAPGQSKEPRYTLAEIEAAITKARAAHGAPIPFGAIWVDALRAALQSKPSGGGE